MRRRKLQSVTSIQTTRTTLKRHLIPFLTGQRLKYAAHIAAIASVCLAGCSGSPSISVLGAYFPDWLFCIVAGVVLTVVLYLILKRLQVDHWLWPSAVVFPTLVTFLSLAVWLMLFQR
ncbi:hypothetical protein G3O01_22070 [Burkholderia sp. Ac-20365]|jgi:hypothetical protein|nr:hypothetical protein [Burkholderia sp. Ac-20365]